MGMTELGGQASGEPKKRLRELSAEARKLAGSIQDFARGFHPATLEELGLVTSLKAEAASFTKLYRIPVSFSQKNVPESLREDAALCLYRIAQQALRNIGQHSRAKQVRITLAGTSSGIALTIADDGRGFDLQRARAKGGLGLLSMEERARLLGGAFNVLTKPGKGVVIQASIPLRSRKK
jgi:signal transduction histidine kinase